MADTDASPYVMLSVDQTIQFAKGDLVFEHGYYGMRCANPAAREQLYKLLEDDSLKNRRAKIVLTMAYIGEKEDIQKLGDFIANISPDRGDSGCGIIYAYFNTLAIMADRGVEGAAEQLYSMASLDLWDKRKFRDITDEEFHISKSGVIAWHAIISSRFYNEPKVVERFGLIIEPINDTAVKKILAEAIKDIPNAQQRWLRDRTELDNEYRDRKDGTWRKPSRPPIQQ